MQNHAVKLAAHNSVKLEYDVESMKCLDELVEKIIPELKSVQYRHMAITLKTSDFIKVNPDTIHVDIEPKKLPKSKFYEPERPFWLYALKLEHGKYYVGSTSLANPYNRIMQHVDKDGGAKWTKLHAPIEVMEIRDAGSITWTQAQAYERILTSAYMKRYGINKVRGGIYNDPGRMLRIGKDTLLLPWAVDNLTVLVLLMAAGVYIFLRHYLNWW